MVVIGTDDLAAAVTCTGPSSAAFCPGVQMFTVKFVLSEHGGTVAGNDLGVEREKSLWKGWPLVHDFTSSLCSPGVRGRFLSIFPPAT